VSGGKEGTPYVDSLEHERTVILQPVRERALVYSRTIEQMQRRVKDLQSPQRVLTIQEAKEMKATVRRYEDLTHIVIGMYAAIHLIDPSPEVPELLPDWVEQVVKNFSPT
jgi:hypothetical protein